MSSSFSGSNLFAFWVNGKGFVALFAPGALRPRFCFSVFDDEFCFVAVRAGNERNNQETKEIIRGRLSEARNQINRQNNMTLGGHRKSRGRPGRVQQAVRYQTQRGIKIFCIFTCTLKNSRIHFWLRSRAVE
jgi:hypothetical protein